MAAHATPQPACTPASETEIAALFDRWNQALQTGDAEAVANNYAADAVLLPTLSNMPRHDDASRTDYFEKFLKKVPSGRVDRRTIRTGCNDASDTGLYTFTFGDKSVVQARYTFTYGLIEGRWLITSHHSSVMPEAQPQP